MRVENRPSRVCNWAFCAQPLPESRQCMSRSNETLPLGTGEGLPRLLVQVVGTARAIEG